MFQTIAGKRIAVLGFAFKADTGDTRESPAIRICKELLEEKAHIVITDPQAVPDTERDFDGVEYENLCYNDNVYDAAEASHALAVLTDWEEYKSLDFEKIFDIMEKPAFIFDGRNFLDHAKLYEIGFNVYSIGKEPMLHF